MTTLNLEASKKVYELLGDTYASEREYSPQEGYNTGGFVYPRLNFSELIRLLPKIGEKKGWSEDVWDSNRINLRRMSHILAEIYMLAPTEERGMEEVSKYLLSVL